MNQLNSIILEGHLVKDSVLSEPVSGFKVCKFSIGVNRFYINKNNEGVEEVSYFDVETYNHSAEICQQKGKKGRGIRVVGRLKQDTWKDSDGKLASRVYVVAEHIEYKPVFQKNPPQKSEAPSAKQVEVQAPANEQAVAVPVAVEETVF